MAGRGEGEERKKGKKPWQGPLPSQGWNKNLALSLLLLFLILMLAQQFHANVNEPGREGEEELCATGWVLATMVLQKEIPKVHIFSTRTGDVIVRPDLNCFITLPSLPTSPCAELWPLHPSLQNGEHYFGSRWQNAVYVIKDNKLLEAKDLASGPSGEARRLHPSCSGGQHYFIVGGDSFGIILSPGSVAAVADLTTGEPVPFIDSGQHQQLKEKMESVHSYLYWHLQDNFSGEFFSFHPNILNFLPGGLGLTKGPAFGSWKLLKTFRNYSDTSTTKIESISWKVGAIKEKLAEIGHAWKASQPGSPEPGAVAVALTKAQFALPIQYGGLGRNTEEEEWGEVREQEEIFQFTLQPEGAAYVWQYHLGLGKETILLCKEIKITHDSDPPSAIPPAS